MIYLEILELNCCGLNKYTKRNIGLRGLIENFDNERDSSVVLEKIDINKDYFLEGIKKNERPTEMEDRAESMVEIPTNNAIN